jgi:hypothetical protein
MSCGEICRISRWNAAEQRVNCNEVYGSNQDGARFNSLAAHNPHLEVTF